MLFCAGGALYFPPQATARTRANAVRFMAAPLSQPGARDEGEREPGQGVLEEVLLRLVVEEILDLEVDPQRPDGADAGAGVDAQLCGEAGAVERVAGHLAAEGEARIAFEAVATARQASEELVRRAVDEVMALEAAAQVDGVQERVSGLGGDAPGQRRRTLQLDTGDASGAGVVGLAAEGWVELVEDQLPIARPEDIGGEREVWRPPGGAGVRGPGP